MLSRAVWIRKLIPRICAVGQGDGWRSGPYICQRDAAVVGTGEHAVSAGRVVTVDLVGAISTVVLVVTLPRVEDAAAVATAVLRGTACVERCRGDSTLRCHQAL